ncbi:hypothetical protein WJ85_17155 [Burkholderia ubonensis]|uniref:lytic transglycosylase domain-containing protein n=1 Tax=Burkholderia ubonensis TaxID=101571 RepID=UPI00075D07A3|nr:lytic transglycosylase domain-containing protein [Burkholderia ubonensis]KVP11960.1 hypothetical protein WJ85_17155 [Burkholderia ubonensis]
MAGNFTGAQGFLANPLIATLPPDQQQNLLQLQQRQAIGQALLAQGMQPADYGGANVGGIAYHVSPLNGAAKLLSTYLGNKMTMDSLGQQANLMAQMYGNSFGVTQGSSATAPEAGESVSMPAPAAADVAPMQGVSAGMGLAQPTAMQLGQAMGAQPAQAPASAARGPLQLPGMTPQASMALFSMLGPEGYARVMAQWGAPTDASRMANAAGLDPAQANADALFKANYIAPNQGTPGTIARDPRTNRPIYYSPSVPEGAQPVFDASGNLAGIAPLPGAAGAIANAAAARAGGEGSMLPFSAVDAAGNPLPITSRTAAATQAGANSPASAAIVQTESGGNPNAISPKGAVGAWQVMPNTKTDPGFGVRPAANNSPAELNRVGHDYYNAMVDRYGSPTIGAIAYNMGPGATDAWLKKGARFEDLPAETRNYVGKVSTLTALNGGAGAPAPASPMYAAAPMGAQAGANTGATAQQNELSKKWTDLNTQNQQAQTTISYLQNIKTLAPKANLGQTADKLAYANSLLAFAGSEKAQDITTANNLLDKYSNQIVARLGQGGLGTDAARAIVESAYPGRHMNQPAIDEAVDNLVGANQMVQAKARLLAPLRTANDAGGYTKAELTFDQNADPRIFQYANIADPAKRAMFAKQLQAQDPGVVQKIQALQQLGVFK